MIVSTKLPVNLYSWICIIKAILMKQMPGSNMNCGFSLCTAVCDVPYKSALAIERIYKLSLWK